VHRAKKAPKDEHWRPAPEGAHSLAHRPLSARDISNAEQRLGFTIPSVLAAVYTKIANGGFGPVYGPPGAHHWQWPEKLLPVVHLGSAMFFCSDCSSDDGMVI